MPDGGCGGQTGLSHKLGTLKSFESRRVQNPEAVRCDVDGFYNHYELCASERQLSAYGNLSHLCDGLVVY